MKYAQHFSVSEYFFRGVLAILSFGHSL